MNTTHNYEGQKKIQREDNGSRLADVNIYETKQRGQIENNITNREKRHVIEIS